MTFDEAVREYLGAAVNRDTQREFYSLKRLLPHFGGRALGAVRRLEVREYISARLRDGVKPATVNRELDVFSAVWNYACFTHEIEAANPAAKMSLTEPEGRLRWLSRREAECLLDAAGQVARTPVLRSFVQIALHTGCRKSELLKLEWPRVDLKAGFLRLEGQHTKSRRRRVVPLNQMAIASLEELRGFRVRNCPESRWVFCRTDGRRVTTLQKGFEAAKRLAGIEDFRIHDLRHTFASWLVMQGVSLYVVRDLLGHQSIEMTERYAHLAPEQLSSAVQLLLRFDG